ncbi:MAG TPA: 30S ribosomal protein S5 [Victivallales bacterium]|nr:30S ribosomal protein S5 [Victivallales bacterium]
MNNNNLDIIPETEIITGTDEKVICVNRCAKVVKGGRNFSFSALVVAGDRNGKVGMGFGKANEVSDAIKKAGDNARKNMIKIPLKDTTIPYPIESKFRAGKVIIKPAAPGTGIIAGGGVRVVLELAGVRDVLAKSLGSGNQINVVKATMNAISKLVTEEEILAKRGKVKKHKVEEKTNETA